VVSVEVLDRVGNFTLGFFLTGSIMPLASIVGAVVIISGGCGTGGAVAAWAWRRALADSCGSEACRNLSILKRRCLLDCSCTGGDCGRVVIGISTDVPDGLWPLSSSIIGDKKSATEGLRGICSLALPGDMGVGIK
jgi:hypothetical protein